MIESLVVEIVHSALKEFSLALLDEVWGHSEITHAWKAVAVEEAEQVQERSLLQVSGD